MPTLVKKYPGQFGLMLDLNDHDDYLIFIARWLVENQLGGDPNGKFNGDFIDASGKPVYHISLTEYLTYPQGSSGWTWATRYWPQYQANQDPSGQQIVSLGANLDTVGAVGVVGYDSATLAVRQYLEGNFTLPPGWTFDVKYYEVHTVDYSRLVNGAYIPTDAYVIEASAIKAGRDPVPAGKSSLDPKLYNYEVAKVWNLVAQNFPDVSKPALSILLSRCYDEDGLRDPAIQVAGSPVAIPMSGTEFVRTPAVSIGNANQGNDSSGQAPWDAQPDVVLPVSDPGVIGNDPGAGYTPTTSGAKTDPQFLNWLNLELPDASQVSSILVSATLTDIWYNKFLAATKGPLPVMDRAAHTIPGFPQISLPDPQKPKYDLPIDDGVGAFPNPPGGVPAVQGPPMNQATIDATAVQTDGEIHDAVWSMLNLVSTDYLNVLGEQYQDTLKKIAANSVARADLNSILEDGESSQVERYLRNWDGSKYATNSGSDATDKNAPPPPPTTKTATSEKTMLIVAGLGILGLVYLVQSGRIRL